VALDATLQRAERDAQHGDLGKARDRLEGLLSTYPGELGIRRRLGGVYWQLGYPERAGRQWYLLPSEDERMQQAKAVFRARYGSDLRLMLAQLGYRGGLEAVRGTYAEQVLRELAAEAGLDSGELDRLTSDRGGRGRGIRADRRSALLNQLVSAARSVVTYEAGLPQGCRRIANILTWLSQQGVEIDGRAPIIAYCSAIAEFPAGSERLLWNREALHKYDAGLEKLNRRYRDRVFEACWEIIDRYSAPEASLGDRGSA
jgi:hypothetical protein